MTTDVNVIPIESPWFFRLSFQGIKVKKKYRELIQIDSIVEKSECSQEMDDKNEELLSAQFSCKYGKEGNPIFRKLIDELENTGVASHSELMTLVMGGDIYYSESSAAKIKLPTLTALAGIFILTLSLLMILAFTFLIMYADASLPIKLFLLFISNVVLIICSYYFYKYSIHPYLLAKKLRASLLSFISGFQLREKYSLKLIATN